MDVNMLWLHYHVHYLLIIFRLCCGSLSACVYDYLLSSNLIVVALIYHVVKAEMSVITVVKLKTANYVHMLLYYYGKVHTEFTVLG